MALINKRLFNRIFACLLPVLCCLTTVVSAQNAAPEIAARIIVIGDAGKLLDGRSPVTEALSKYIHQKDGHTTIVFAGDNLYPEGLPEQEDKTYESQAHVLRSLILSFKQYKAHVYVIPGNHDWQKGGPKGWEAIRRQENFVVGLGEKNMTFLPSGGCPGPEEIPLSDSVTMVIMDTQWWLHKGEKPGLASDCDCKTEDEIVAKLEDIAYRNKGKRIVFVAHHPLRSNGEHGGYYTLKQHIFPFTDLNKNAYIPLPVIGSLYPLVRGAFGNIEDLPHPLYKDMIRAIEQSFEEAADVTYVGGHEHNLQLIREGKRNYVVSGSGINRDRVRKRKHTLYASDERGFTEIIYTKAGRQQINYFIVKEDATFDVAYSFDVPYISPANEAPAKDPAALLVDSITIAIAPQYDAPGKIHRLFFGEHYRKIWATPVKMSVFHIEKEMGGLKVLKRGGGQQTKSLRLEDKSGRQWVLRTIQKNPEKALPANLRSTIAKPIVQDQTSAANPYAAVTVPVLAEAAGVPHTDPRIVYIPDDPALGVYRRDFANTVCVFEEREPGTESYSTQKVLDKLQRDNDNIVDEKAVLRARMLDLLIGDWDRHEDQWRWTKKEVGNKTIYSPVPRDRDQVYYINTGILPYIAGRDWLMPKFQGFGPNVHNVTGFMFNARYFDRLFLHQLSRSDWEDVITSLQNSLTDPIIQKAVKQLPDTVYRQIGPSIIRDLISRRNNLMRYGMEYYAFLSKAVDIPASDKKEIITIQNDSAVKIILQKMRKDGSAGDTTYYRAFDEKITKEVRIYGRDGADRFLVQNNRASGIKMRLIGGDGRDSFFVDKSQGINHLLIYDRSDKQNSYPAEGFARRHLSVKNKINDYNPRSFKYNRLAPIATAGYNMDDGLLIGFGGVYTRQGFRREPFASKHRVMIGGAFATGAFFLKYKGDVTDFIGKASLNLSLNIHAPDNTTNFFGVGNETSFDKVTDPDIRYYRTRYNFIDMQAKLRWPLGKNFSVFTGITGQYFNMSFPDNTGRFIIPYEQQHRDQELFDHKVFAGAVAGYEIDTRNDSLFPLRGFHWKSTLTGVQQLDQNKQYGQLQTDMSFYVSFSRYPKWVIANRTGAGISIGAPAFFQMFYLGGEKGLMGYRKNRFSGSSVLYNNLELRLKLFDFASYLFPGAVGLVGFNDLGRVWAEGQTSNKWHLGYGGGFYVMPAEAVVVTAIAACSEEGLLPYISLGFRF